MRRSVLPEAAAPEEQEEQEAPCAAGRARDGSSPSKRSARLDWARLLRNTLKVDVFECTRGEGSRKVLASLTHTSALRSILQHLMS
ncbi:hypothetical protein [Archangium sp.]|uniref:hypothetical protein n=1 Tax=Archangium sp. TaxID=1872627 RepID=UPI002D631C91|nr:hypothetical protein [Archangium sp.]HYO55755.1 hypothetical protein [Archangium sp.]